MNLAVHTAFQELKQMCDDHEYNTIPTSAPSLDASISLTQVSRSVLKLSTFMKICHDLSVLSHDLKYNVASIAVTDDFREIASIGFNGDYAGGPNERTNFSHGQSALLHAEENLISHLSKPYELRRYLIIFCTHKPCTMCAKRITNSGIRRVVYDLDYIDELGMTNEIFAKCGIRCENYHDLMSSQQNLDSFLNNREQ
jgi:dCMP deaminase